MRRICITGDGFDQLFGIPTTYRDFLESQLSISKLVSSYLTECEEALKMDSPIKKIRKISTKAKYNKVRKTNTIFLYLMYFDKKYENWSELENKLQSIHVYFVAMLSKMNKIRKDETLKLSIKDCFFLLKEHEFNELDENSVSDMVLRESYFFRKFHASYIDLVERKVDKIITNNREKQTFKRDLRRLFFMNRDADARLYKQTEIINFNNSDYFAKYIYTKNNYEELSYRYVISMRDDDIEEKIFARRFQKKQFESSIDFSDYVLLVEAMHLKRITKIQNVAKQVESLHFYVINFSKYEYRYFFEVFDRTKILSSNIKLHFYYEGNEEKKKQRKIEVAEMLNIYCHQDNKFTADPVQMLIDEKRIILHKQPGRQINLFQEMKRYKAIGTFDVFKEL